MNLNLLKKMYTNSPFWLKYLYAKIPFYIRNGSTYNKWRSIIDSTNIIQRDPLKTVKYGISNFQFYKDFYYGLDTENFENLPLLTKDRIQKSLGEFDKNNSSKFYVTTGGVTGKPGKFYQSNNIWFKELAFVYNYFEGFGYNPTKIKASFRGGDFSDLKKNRYWLYNPNYNEFHFSPFHLNQKTVECYVSKLNKLKPKYFHGYPSVFITLAKLMVKQNLKLDYTPSTIFLISEGFTERDIDFLRVFFKCEVSSFYGHSERLVFAPADKELKSYTPNLVYGYFELIDKNGNVIRENNIDGEIVGTSYDNLAMPLIRYRTGDYTSYIDFKTKTFAPITGKWGQMSLVGLDNEEITLTSLNLHSEELDNILKVQFVQKEKGKVTMFLIFQKNTKKNDLNLIEKLLTERVGSTVNFKAVECVKFKLNSRGKAPLIINTISV
jgi:phenylacetate-CoA ligase